MSCRRCDAFAAARARRVCADIYATSRGLSGITGLALVVGGGYDCLFFFLLLDVRGFLSFLFLMRINVWLLVVKICQDCGLEMKFEQWFFFMLYDFMKNYKIQK